MFPSTSEQRAAGGGYAFGYVYMYAYALTCVCVYACIQEQYHADTDATITRCKQDDIAWDGAMFPSTKVHKEQTRRLRLSSAAPLTCEGMQMHEIGHGMETGFGIRATLVDAAYTLEAAVCMKEIRLGDMRRQIEAGEHGVVVYQACPRGQKRERPRHGARLAKVDLGIVAFAFVWKVL